MSPSPAKFSCFFLCVTVSIQSAGAEGLESETQRHSDEECRKLFADDPSGKRISQIILDTFKTNNSNGILAAERLAKSARKLVPESPEILAACAYLAYQHSKVVASPAKRDLYLEAAESLAKKSIDKDEKQELAYRTLGLVKLAQDEAREAIKPLRRACELVDNHVNLALLSQSLLEVNPRDPEAKKLLDRAMDIKSDYAPAHLQLAISLCATGKPKEAARELNAVPPLERNSDWYVAQGTLSEKQNKENEALQSWARASVEDPRAPAPYRKKAAYFEKKGKPNQAIAEYHVALEAFTNDFAMRQALAELALRNNNLDVAESEFKTILTARPDDIKALIGLAQVGFRIYGKDGPYPLAFNSLLDRLEYLLSKADPTRIGIRESLQTIEKHKDAPSELMNLGQQFLSQHNSTAAEKAFTYALAYPSVRQEAQKALDKIEIESYRTMAESWCPMKFPKDLDKENFDLSLIGNSLLLLRRGKLEESRQVFQKCKTMGVNTKESEYYLNFLNRILPKAGDK